MKEGYHSTLSAASKVTLRHQGGPMTLEEARAFEQEDLHKLIVAMRHWDEAAKVKGKEVPGLESYRQLMDTRLDVLIE